MSSFLNKQIITKIHQSSYQGGFSILEVLITAAIIGIITGLVVFQYGAFNNVILLKNQAFQIALDLREMQTRALSSIGQSADFRSPYGVYFSTGLPDIILRMLGIPESYSGIPYEDFHELVRKDDDGPEKERAKHPAAYDGSYDYDMFRYSMSDETIKKFLDYKREHRDEYRRIRAEQAKLGDRLHEPDAYDALYDELIKAIDTGKIRPDQPENNESE